MKTLAQNRKAYHEYEILERFEAGIVLTGVEVKSVKDGRMSIKGSYVRLRGEEAFLQGAVIPPYQPANTPPGYDSQRERKLLLRRQEIKGLIGKVGAKGLTLVPLRVYTKNGLIKVRIALVKGRSKKDKREKMRKEADERRMRRHFSPK